MTAPSNTLSLADVRRLAGDRSAESRIAVVAKIVQTAEAGLLALQEQEMARDLLRRLARDAALQVREAVAWQIYNSPLLSDDLAHDLALDVVSVAFPLLRHCERLGDDLLLQVIGQDEASKQLAIAARNGLSSAVSAALVDVGNLAVVATLAANEGASISDETLELMADRYANVPLVAEPLAGRAVLPASVLERLVASASELVRDLLVERHRLSPVVAGELTGYARDSATLALLRPMDRPGMAPDALAVHLNNQGRLSIALLLRALCAGDFDFFLAGLMAKSRITRRNIHSLMAEETGEGLRALLEHAHVPKRLCQPFLLAQEVAREQGYAGGDDGRVAFQAAVLGRLYVQCGQSEDRAMDDLLLQLFDGKGDSLIDEAMDQAGLPFLPLRGTVPR